MASRLTIFLKGSGTDDRGRTIAQVINWPDGELERCHDFVQWTFPTPSRSRFNPDAPVLNDAVLNELLSCPEAIENVRRMLMRMYAFYSFDVTHFEDGTYQLELDDEERRPWWITPGNHNYLRITRILQTLRSLNLDEDLSALGDILDLLARRHHDVIGETTIHFWREFIDI